MGPEIFLGGSPRQNANLYPAREKTPVRLQVDWTHFFREALGKTQISGRRSKTFRSRFMEPETFFWGSPTQNANFYPAQEKNPVHSEVDRTLFWGEALSKTQISGANTRLALIIFKRSNGNWIFLRWLARASLSRDCFNSLLAPCSNIVTGMHCKSVTCFITVAARTPQWLRQIRR